MSKMFTLPRILQSARALALSVAAVLASTHVHAGGMPVIDISAILAAAEENVKQAQRWAETHTKWAQDLAHYKDVMNHYGDVMQHYRQQLIELTQLKYKLLQLESQFPKVPDDYGVAEACSSNESLMDEITGVLKSALPSLDGDIRSKQTRICQQIAMTKNRKYNNTVDYLHRIADAATELQAIESQRATVDEQSGRVTQGTVAANSNEVARFQSHITEAREQWQGNNMALDAQLSLLETKQSVLAKRAMKGDQTILGQVIQAAALEAALKINKP